MAAASAPPQPAGQSGGLRGLAGMLAASDSAPAPEVGVALREAGAPPFPGVGSLPMATVPPAPLLPAAAEEADLAAALAQAYRAAWEARLGGVCWLLRNWNPRSPSGRASKSFGLLAAAGAALRAAEIPPVAWAAWSFDAWADCAPGAGPARLEWVFSPARVQKHAAWFHAEGPRGREVVWTERARALLGRWRAMEGEALEAARRGALTPERALGIRRRYFPDGAWEAEVGKAAAEAQERRRELEAAAAAGRWVWG